MNSIFNKVASGLFFLVLASSAQADVIQDHRGHWLGDMKIPNGPTLKLGVSLFTRADGSSWASVSLPAQNNFDIPVSSVKEVDQTLSLVFSGKVNMKLRWVSDHFDAEFQEPGGPQLKFTMAQVDKMPIQTRPQTPKPPFNYRDETVAIKSLDGVVLSGTLSIPNFQQKPNVVILVHGSGPNNRNQSGEGHEPFAVLADQLARQGIAVLRYDKRGIAQSSGDYDQHTEQQLSDDVFAAAQAMKARGQFKRIGVIAHSEGPGIAATMIAQHPKAVDFMVSMAGVGLPGLEMMLLQDRTTATANGATPKEVDSIVNYARGYYQIMLAQENIEKRMEALNQYIAQAADGKALADKYKMNQGSLSLSLADKAFLTDFLKSDNTKAWRQVKVPVLALNGSLDQQVPVASLEGIQAALKAGGNKKVEAHVLPKLNHVFQTATTGAEEEYAKIEETIAPVALQKIAAFVLKKK